MVRKSWRTKLILEWEFKNMSMGRNARHAGRFQFAHIAGHGILKHIALGVSMRPGIELQHRLQDR